MRKGVAIVVAQVEERERGASAAMKAADVLLARIQGTQTGADIVLTGRLLDYGKVQWKYWAAGLVISMLAETLIVEAPDLIRSLWQLQPAPYIAGWAFRPARIKVKALQITGCEHRVWKEQELIVLIPGKSLKKHPARIGNERNSN